MKHAIVIEKIAGSNYSAYFPDVASHLDGMREDGLSIPEPTTLVDYAEVA